MSKVDAALRLKAFDALALLGELHLHRPMFGVAFGQAIEKATAEVMHWCRDTERDCRPTSGNQVK